MAGELEDLAQKRLLAAFEANPSDMPYGKAADVLEALKSHGLLFELPEPSRGHFRSRTAEAIRLFFYLKQFLPRHLRDGHWRAAPDLVADYRLILRPREYPKRHVSPESVERRLAATGAGDQLSRSVIRTMLHAESDRPLMLADFQLEAAERILGEAASRPRRAGTIVCAGTGSGKTLAFYLPALIVLAGLSSPDRWTRCLALYPRNELLKDQLASALRAVYDLNGVLADQGRFPIAVGALFGEVPRTARDDETLRRNWKRIGSGASARWSCPYLSCPGSNCGGSSLVWLEDERRQGIERLRCDQEGCGFTLDSDLFILTRASMQERPPDLLFTGLEMVNQSMSAVPTWPLLGIGIDSPGRRPQLVLLDEVHTYSGIYGAQAALLVRRWKRASVATPHFVGLSATLEGARRFFSDLIGEPESRVEEVSPRSSDLEQEAQEVLLALRGDPVSKTSLLSTSIQASMLLRRVLDPVGSLNSLFGSKLFVFTDNLDVTNRLFHALLDAEGWQIDSHGAHRPRREPPLAGLRSRDTAEHGARFDMGQSWDLAEDIGHELTDRPVVRVGRTSSQDAGVDRDAETLVATASLEVGFDDPWVGAVLQHKAPRDPASFLQRKGRAGRLRGTRPWTVVVLSDYGRDRFAYQGYEQLFSPQLRPRYLPIHNRYVLRIHATLALMDWLAAMLRSRHSDTRANLWPALAQPPPLGDYQRFNEKRLDRIGELVEEVLAGGAAERTLARYLEQALAVGPQVVRQLLWEPPRSLMLAVLPTIVRRLRSRWAVAVPPGSPGREEPNFRWSPLPEFVPRTLFDDLNLPEVTISLPGSVGAEKPEHMPIVQALQEFAPGRVSRRFGVLRREVSHWLPIPEDGSEWCLVEDFCAPGDADEIGLFRIEADGVVSEVPCLRPRRITVRESPRSVGTTSNARLVWGSQLLPRVEGVPGELPFDSPWLGLLRSVSFFTHGYGNPIEVRRFARASRYQVYRVGGESDSGSVSFARRTYAGPQPVALGYAIDVDAIRIEVEPPPELHRRVRRDSAIVKTLRTARFTYEVQSAPDLDGIANTFERGWLVQICLSALTLEATAMLETTEGGTTLLRAAESLFGERALTSLEQVLEVIFYTFVVEGDERPPGDRRDELRRLLLDPVVRDTLHRAAPSLWTDPAADWEPWLRERLLTTLGTALLDACQQACPDLDGGDLCLDIDPGPRGLEDGCPPRERDELWLSESSPGGSGVIEALASVYASDPRRFLRLVEAALSPSDFETIDDELATLISWLDPESPFKTGALRQAVAAVRMAGTYTETVKANDELRHQLEVEGIATPHPVLVAMQARILRPGSSAGTDKLLARMVRRWRDLEERLGIDVDARIVAYIMSEDDDLDRALAPIGTPPTGADRRVWRYNTLYGLLWPRGAEVRSQTLSAFNPFAALPPTDRWLVALALPSTTTTEIDLEADAWYQRLCLALVNEGEAVLSSLPQCRRELRTAILQTLVDALDTDTLLVQPALIGLTREGRRLRARFEVREGLQ